MSEKPLVSAIMIFLNEERFLEEAVQSVLGQTYDHWELLLVDDGSSDRSTELARRYAEQFPGKVRYLEHPGHANHGMSASRNLGIRNASGEYIAFLDADDVWLPVKLEEQVAILRAHPTAALAYGRTLIWHSWTGQPEDRRRDYFYTLGVQPDQLIQPPRLLIQLLENQAQTPTTCNVIIRRRVFDEVGLFEEIFRSVHEDQVFYTKVYHRAPAYVANACWAKYRQHADSSSATAQQKGMQHAARLRYLAWIEKYLTEQGVKDPDVWKALHAESWRYRHPRLAGLRQQAANLAPWSKKHVGRIARKALPQPVRHRLKPVLENRRARKPRVLILMYHRMAEPSSDPYRLCVSPRHFEEHLEVMRKYGPVLSLPKLVNALDQGKLPRRGFAITFDDGYVDNLRAAKPLLERHSAPATVFVISGAVPMKREFWWDELDRLLLQPGSLPQSLTLDVNGSARTWELAEASRYSDADQRDRGWDAYQAPELLRPRQRFFQSVQQFAYQLNGEEKEKMLVELASWSEVSAAVRPDLRTLSPAELKELALGDLIEIGAHTATHPVLSSLWLDKQYSEIHGSKSQLEQLLDRPVTSIAFPHGDYSPDTLIAVREAGFACACTTEAKAVRQNTDRLQLPRYKVEDWDGDQFSQKIDAWFREE